jgi:tRNA(fMet)-specific endonuclease VapC
MPPRYLLDTNIVSYLLNGRMPLVRSKFDLVTAEAVAISSISEAEVFYGLALKPGTLRLRFAAEALFASVTCMAWDSAAARNYGSLRVKQRQIGRPLSLEDMMIAAHAIAAGLILVTHDAAFSFVEGLKTEDWTIQ